MIEVLVAEDEKPILRNIVKAIETADPDFKVRYTAHNGRQAKEYLDTCQIDAAFLDINMPIYDGLSLLKYIWENNIEVIPVILTGYQEFDYARKALQYHAFDYLLKPLEEDKLESFLGRLKIEAQLRKSKNTPDILKEMPHSFLKSKNGLQEKCLLACCFLGGYSKGETADETREKGKETEAAIKKYLEEKIGKNSFWLAKGHLESERILFVSAHVSHPRELFENMPDETEGELLPVTIVIGAKPAEIAEINSYYQKLCAQAKEKMEFEKSGFHLYEEIPGTCGAGNGKELEIILSRIQPDITADALINIFKKTMELSGTKRKNLEYGTKSFFIRLCEKVPNRISYLDIEDEILCVLENEFRFDSLVKRIEDMIRGYFYLNEETNKNKDQLAEKIEGYIVKNYRFPFTSQIIEEKFGYSAFYLRTIFKEAYGMSPNEYLLQVRMEKAILLLREGMQTKDVAEEVGYSDPFYFSKVFKKYTGQSPSKFISTHLF